MPLSNLQGTKQSPVTNSYLAKNVSNAKIEKPRAEDQGIINSGVLVNIRRRISKGGREAVPICNVYQLTWYSYYNCV